MDALREYTKNKLGKSEKFEEWDMFDDEGSGSGGTVITPAATMVVYFQNPSAVNEELLVRDFLPQNSLLEDLNLHNEDTTYTSVEYDDKNAAEKAFLKACEEGKTAIMTGHLHHSSSIGNVRWLSPEELQDTRVEIEEPKQISGMLLNVAPASVFSISLSFAEQIAENQVEAEVKELYRTHLSFEVGPRGTALRGLIESPNYPASYPANSDMKWLFHMPVNHNYGIQFNLDELSTEACCDRLVVYDGVTTNAQVLGMYSGVMQDNAVTTLTTQSSDLLVQFQSDCYKESGKFSFTFESVTTGETLTCEDSTTIQGTYGEVQSPGYPTDYPSNADCVWIIQVTPGQWVELDLLQFNINSRDVVTVYYFPDGSQNDVIIANYSGAVTKNESVVAESNQLYIRLISGIHEIPEPGFSFAYSAVKPPTACNEGLVIEGEDMGVITSENYPNDYNDNAYCRWLIIAPEGSILSLKFDDFATEVGYDWVYIFDGQDANSVMIEDTSGTIGNNRVYYTTSNSAYIEFQSDSSVNYGGFSMTFKTYIKSEQCLQSSVLSPLQPLEGPRGLVSTPNYPDPFPGFIDCEYLLKTESLTAMGIDIRGLDLGVNTDNRLVFYDGPTAASRELFDTDSLAVPLGNFLFNSTQNEVYAHFTSLQDNFEDNGFGFFFHEFDLNTICAETVELTEPQGTFSSALYPGYYPSDVNVCSWYIRTSPLSYVTVRTDYFLVGVNDVLTFYNGDGPDQASYITNCRRYECDHLIKANRNQMYVLFESQSSNPGFQFSYYSSSDSCAASAQQTTNDGGYIASTNFPFEYNANESCAWNVVTGLQNTIELTIPTFDTEKDHDILIIYDTNSNEVIANLSGIHAEERFFTTGNNAFVQFTSDEYTEARGFELYYKAVIPDKPFVNDTVYECISVDVVNRTSGRIYSHNFPQAYPLNLDYCWLFYGGGRRVFDITFSFTYFDTEPLYDFVSVYEGSILDPNYLIASYSGIRRSFDQIVTGTSVATVFFHTDGDNDDLVDHGWVLDYKVSGI